MNRRPMLAAMTLFILHLCALPALAAEDAQARAGVLEDLRGTVTARQEAGQPRAIPKGGPVLVKDILTTGPEDRGKIVFADDSVLEIGPDSEIRIEEFAYDTSDRDNFRQGLKMAKGLFRYATGKIVAQNPDRLKIESPLASIGIRGTTTDHMVTVRETIRDGAPVRVVEDELHALRQSKTKTQVVVTHLNKPTVLKKQDMAASLKPKTPAVSRPLTEAEKKTFATIPLSPAPFDPRPGLSLTGGGQ
ncbi:MAG: FecR family protein [Thermodesulfobacteriota bacterium]